MPSTYFPDLSVLPSFRRTRVHQTLVEESFGRSQKMALLPVGGRRGYQIDLSPLTIDDQATLHDFLDDQQGQFGTFYYFDPVPKKFTSVSLGVTTNAVLIYTLPYKKDAAFNDAQTISLFKKATVTQANPADYGLTTATNGEINIVLTANPGDGASLVISGSARERVIVRQATDQELESFIDGYERRNVQSIVLIEEL